MRIYHETEHGVLWHGDCLEVMQTMPDKSVDLVLTDPPYGIKMDVGFSGSWGFSGNGDPIKRRKYDDDWDSKRPDKQLFDTIIKTGRYSIIFGGNFFADILPMSTHWIVWDKLNTMPTFGDCELAYTTYQRKSVKKYTIEYNGLIGKEQHRFHPTQKPVRLFAALIGDYTVEGETILDPFAGSGTTAIACIRLNRKYILIEKEEKYCEIIAKRINTELDQTDIFRSTL